MISNQTLNVNGSRNKLKSKNKQESFSKEHNSINSFLNQGKITNKAYKLCKSNNDYYQ